jgi:50S ribosomal protein L16 3-hydroxylase
MMEVDIPTQLLGGLKPSQFMRRHWQKKPLLVRQAMPGVRPPASRVELFSLAQRDDVESRLVVQQGQRWTLRPGPLPRRALPPLAQPGWSLLVQGLDLHVDAAHALLRPFRFLPEARLDDLMVSYASDGGGVGPHVDSYDVFLLQVHGQRRWRIGPGRRPQWRSDVPLKMLAGFEVTDEWVLAAGDMLYLPPGWAHDGVAVGGDCMTASIGFRAPTAGELAQALLPLLAEAIDSGGGRYRDARAGATSQPGLMPAPLQAFAREALGQVLADQTLAERALGQWITEPKPRVWFDAGDSHQGRTATTQAVLALDRKSRVAYDAHDFYLNGESYLVGGRDARVLQRLADDRALPYAAMRGLSTAAREAVDDWLAQGWVHWKECSDG